MVANVGYRVRVGFWHRYAIPQSKDRFNCLPKSSLGRIVSIITPRLSLPHLFLKLPVTDGNPPHPLPPQTK